MELCEETLLDWMHKWLLTSDRRLYLDEAITLLKQVCEVLLLCPLARLCPPLPASAALFALLLSSAYRAQVLLHLFSPSVLIYLPTLYSFDTPVGNDTHACFLTGHGILACTQSTSQRPQAV